MADEQPTGRVAQSGLVYRTFALTAVPRAVRSEDDADDALEVDEEGRIRVALSSEAPVTRYDYRTGEEFNEVLDHGAIDLSRCDAQGGLPLITDHDSWNSDAQLGILEAPEVGGDRMLRFWARFSKSARAQEYRQDVLDGIRRTVSVGYALPETYRQDKAAGAGLPTRTYAGWQPREGSFTPVPADVAVGFGRSAAGAATLGAGRATTAARHGQEPRMSEVTTPTPAPAPVVTVGDGGERTATVRQLAALAKEHQMEAALPRWLEQGTSVELAAVECARAQAEKAARTRTDVPLVELNEREQKQYSFARAILANDPQMASKYEAGFEREVSDSMRREAQTRGVPVVGKGQIMIPSRMSREGGIAGRANLTSATASAGGVLKFNMPGDFIDYLYNAVKTLGLGAKFLTGLTGPVVFPRGVNSTTATWNAEAPGSDATESALTMDTVTLAFNTLIVNQPISRQLLFSAASGGYDAEALVRRDIARVHAVALETAAINGTGTNQPTGILSTSGVNLVTLGANGGTMTFSKALEMEQSVADQNADVESMGFLSNAKQRATMRGVQILSNTTGVPLWDFGNGPQDNRVLGYKAAVTNAVPRTLTKGTATTACSAIIFGDFSRLIYGEWGGFEILLDPYTLAARGMYKLVSFQAASAVVQQPKAFSQIVDAL